jgi:hypothetical protein
MTVPTNPQNSISVCQSRPLRASRETSIANTNAALADRRQQPLEARPRDAAARAAEIVVDDLDGSPTELFGATGQTVLAPQALLVGHKLIGGRLADVDEGAAGEMVSRDLGHR